MELKTINQGRVSTSARFPFLEKYGLMKYTNRSAPAVFFGCYRPPEDMQTILNHKGLGVVVWLGTDAMMMTPRDWAKMRQRGNLRHVAIGKFLRADLKRAGMSFVPLPLFPGELVTDPCPLGEHVYIYLGKSPERRPFYGSRLLHQIRKKTSVKIIEGAGQFTRNEMKTVYRKCFLGLRLTPHDGLPNTVIEMGLMGRRCVYNGGLPGSIPWRTADDVLQAIETERKAIGQTNLQLADAMYNYLNIGDEWLNVRFWQ